MKKLFVNSIICLTLAVTLSGGMEAKAATITVYSNQESELDATITTSSKQESELEIIEQQTEEERLASQAKMKLANKYALKKSSQISSGEISLVNYGSYETLSSSDYKTAEQLEPHWCGPASAYNASNGYRSQSTYASLLGTDVYGSTPFNKGWVNLLNRDLPGNNYALTWAHDYSDWTSELKDSIIYTIDKGYPVIADCLITSDTDTHIHSGYGYATSTKHYVTVVGYDDTVSPAEVLIVDSHPSDEIPARYWTTIDQLSAATEGYGIIW